MQLSMEGSRSLSIFLDFIFAPFYFLFLLFVCILNFIMFFRIFNIIMLVNFLLIFVWFRVDFCRRIQRIYFKVLFVVMFWASCSPNLEKWWTDRFKIFKLAFYCKKNQIISTSTALVMRKTLTADPVIRMQKFQGSIFFR